MVVFNHLSQGRQLLKPPVCFLAQQTVSEKGSLKGEKCSPGEQVLPSF